MKKAYFMYRCRMCGVNFVDSHISDENYKALNATINAILKNEDEDAPDVLSVHLCDDTRRGVADLVGYTLEED